MKCQHWWIVTNKPGLIKEGVCKFCDAERVFTDEATHWNSLARGRGNRNSVIARQTTGLVELAIKEAN